MYWIWGLSIHFPFSPLLTLAWFVSPVWCTQGGLSCQLPLCQQVDIPQNVICLHLLEPNEAFWCSTIIYQHCRPVLGARKRAFVTLGACSNNVLQDLSCNSSLAPGVCGSNFLLHVERKAFYLSQLQGSSHSKIGHVHQLGHPLCIIPMPASSVTWVPSAMVMLEIMMAFRYIVFSLISWIVSMSLCFWWTTSMMK